mmetsp:Transcript_28488/g.62339  ORF Transcript_28488/g.62339 Transcript_28488/m.62339 type:complete len:188 (+) Transcript_28488:203-766(+)
MLLPQVRAVVCSLAICTTPLTPPATAAVPAVVADCTDSNPCPRVDAGTCGNACCAIDYSVPASTASARDSLLKILQAGGPDGRYSLPPLEGGRSGFTDLRPFRVEADFIGQAVHTTAGRNYQDTINLAISSGADGTASRVRAFSISNIGGALRDSGQNNRNLRLLMEQMGAREEAVVFGCGLGRTAK